VPKNSVQRLSRSTGHQRGRFENTTSGTSPVEGSEKVKAQRKASAKQGKHARDPGLTGSGATCRRDTAGKLYTVL